MKDIIIKKDRIRKELMVFITVFILVFLLNIYAIIIYKTEWSEVLNELPFVILISIIIFFVYSLIRGLITLIKKFIK